MFQINEHKFIFIFLFFFCFRISKEESIINAVYNIFIDKTKYLNYNNNILQISKSEKYETKSNFRIKKLLNNSFYEIEHINTNLKLSSSLPPNIELIRSNNKDSIEWIFIETNYNKYIIQNKNKCYIKIIDTKLSCENININNATKFKIEKIYEEVNNNDEDIEIIEKEPIDVIIKNMDLSEITLKYSIRSILKNIPWIRKIYILIKNKKIKYFKEYEYINKKIIYINDKEFLGNDSLNINEFEFRYWYLKKYNISNNFIVMNNNNFIGQPLQKSDFFYVEKGNVVPSIIANIFKEENIGSANREHNNYKTKAKKKNDEYRHELFMYSIYSTYIFIIRLLNKSIIVPYYTNNAIPCNINEIKEIYNLLYNNSNYKNPILYSLKNDFKNFHFQTFYMTYTFNKYHIKVNPISYNYINNNNIIFSNYNYSLFCINIVDNDYSSLIFNKTKIVMENNFPEPTPYEIINYNEIPFIAFNIIYNMEKEIKEQKNEIKNELDKYKKEIEKLKNENNILKNEIKEIKDEKYINENITNLSMLYNEIKKKEKIIENQKKEKELKNNYYLERIINLKRELEDKNNTINNLEFNYNKLKIISDIYFYIIEIIIILLIIYIIYKKIKNNSRVQIYQKDHEQKEDSFQVMEMKDIN